MTPACGGVSSGVSPDFGPNVIIFTPSMSMSTIQSQLNTIYAKMDADQFDDLGYAYLFKPGQYSLDVQVGFYTHVIGLGESPDDVVITGAVRAKADWLGNNNATCNFWRTAENLAVVPTAAIDNGTDVWATSQGTSLRRIHVHGSIALDDNGGWASGGFIADSKIDTQINSGSQQQYLTRNVDLTNWQGSNWNMVFVGDGQPPSGTWPQPAVHRRDRDARRAREAVSLRRRSGNYLVMVPALKSNATGSSWGADASGSPVPPGSPLSIDHFYIAKPGVDTATTINAALAAGKHLLLTPGDYSLDAPIAVTQPNTVVFGIGLPVLTPTKGAAVLTVADVDGVTIAGSRHRSGRHELPDAARGGRAQGARPTTRPNPTVLFDVHCRIGGNIARHGRGLPHRQQQRRHHRQLAGSGAPTTAAGVRLGLQQEQQRHRRERRRRDGVRPLRRAPPAVSDAVERQRRRRLLLPVRDAVRPAEPGGVDGVARRRTDILRTR